MKRNKVFANTGDASEIVLTPAALLDLLSQVEELNQYDIGLYTGLDGNLQLQIGDSYYDLTQESEIIDIEVENNVVDTIAEVSEEAYDNIDGDAETEAPIESGPIAEVIKTLAIGGLVRLGKHYLTN